MDVTSTIGYVWTKEHTNNELSSVLKWSKLLFVVVAGTSAYNPHKIILRYKKLLFKK